MTNLDNAAAVMALLTPLSAGVGPVTVLDGRSPNLQTTPYLLVDVETALVEVDDTAGTSTRASVTFQLMGVGSDTRQARNVLDRAALYVLDQTPTVAGRDSSPVRQLSSVPVRRDVDDPETWIAVAQYRFWTVPTT